VLKERLTTFPDGPKLVLTMLNRKGMWQAFSLRRGVVGRRRRPGDAPRADTLLAVGERGNSLKARDM